MPGLFGQRFQQLSLDLDLPLSRIVAQLWQASSESLPDNEDFCAIVQRTDAKLYGRGE